MKSEPRGKSTARDLAYIPYVNDGLDLEIQMNYLIDFSWQIFDENLYVIATGDIFPISMLKDAVGDTAKINITRYYKTPVSNIPGINSAFGTYSRNYQGNKQAGKRLRNRNNECAIQ